ncbi:Fungal specific transcription factor [Sporothrix eucalyptigena]|uniref:Fungal specific transcription factor n=1 Tax=Sporothrix eucalyptigena TaxID=1812306 RepID=A0ABP0CTA3_9PEZI
MYSNSKIKRLLGAFIPDLLDLYYAFVHPSYPILEPQEELLQRWRAGKVRTSLMSCICLLATEFWSQSASLSGRPLPLCAELWNDIFVALTIETRTPNFDTVKGLLLYMQLPSHFVKEPNRPGQWALSSLLVGVVQDIGLHVDPSEWRITPAERKARRILWWAVYAHDKWTAHFLGRHPHLCGAYGDVRPLTVNDFSDDAGRIHTGSLAAVRVFAAFAELSGILEDVLAAYCTPASQHHEPAVRSAVASGVLEKLVQWKDKTDHFSEDVSESPSLSMLRIAYHTIQLSIWRTALGNPHPQWEEISRAIAQTTKQIEQVLVTLPQSSADGFWLSCLSYPGPNTLKSNIRN